jgi:hypothetical protein
VSGCGVHAVIRSLQCTRLLAAAIDLLRAARRSIHADEDLAPNLPGSRLVIINARVPRDTGERMDRVLKGAELRSAFIRAAIEAELRRREKARTKV